jgi:hypothetical protein
MRQDKRKKERMDGFVIPRTVPQFTKNFEPGGAESFRLLKSGAKSDT